MKGLLLLTSLSVVPVASSVVNANTPEWCFPENDLYLEDNIHSLDANVSEATFNSILDDISAYYSPIVASHGGTLKIDRNWSDPKVNAFAYRKNGFWGIAMFGGLARRPEVTADAFAMVACHELGHHLGGFTFYDNRPAASEGQADTFATYACANKIWKDKKEENAKFRKTVQAVPKKACDEVYKTTEEQNLCYRKAMAGYSLARLLRFIQGGPEPKFETPDMSVVEETYNRHPKTQCRLDTYFQAALCDAEFDDYIIPGLKHPDGQQSAGAELESAKYDCSDAGFRANGNRPLCWFKPKFSLDVDRSKVVYKEMNGNGNGVWEPGETLAVNIPLVNKLKDSVEGATISVVSAGREKLHLNAKAKYPSIAPGESAYAVEDYELGAPRSMKCGDKVHIKTLVQVNTWKEYIDKDLYLGRFVTIESLDDSPNLEVPDATANGPTSRSVSFDFSNTSIAKHMTVTIDYKHIYRGDMEIAVVSPKGEVYHITQPDPLDDEDDVKGDFDFEIKPEKIAGTWKLVLTDHSRNFGGVLKYWKLDFKKVVCE